MDYNRALIAARNGKALLFYGAGFSCNAESLDGHSLPTGGGLAELICADASCVITRDLKVATTRFLKKKGNDDLIKILKKTFTVKSVSDEHRYISKIPWKAVYTTNYDNVFERASAEEGLKYTPLTPANNPRQLNGANCVVHINGYIDHLDTDSIHHSFKLTNTSYLTQQFRTSAWSEVFIREMQAAHAVFFVGYSLYDIDIQEIIFSDESLKSKTFFIERSDLIGDELSESDLNDFGTILPIGLREFCNNLAAVDPLSISDNNELILTSFSEVKINSPIPHKVRDEDVYSLLLKGDIKEDLLIDRVISKTRNDYIIKRSIEDELSPSINTNANIVIHGDLANGKTILMKLLCSQLLSEGHRVFLLKDEAYDCLEEIEMISALVNKPVIVIENYPNKLDIIGHANLKRNATTKIILTARSMEHERAEEALYYSRSLINPEHTKELCVNKLSSDDLINFSNYFELYGFWGQLAASSQSSKIEYLSIKCNSEIHGILLGLINSPQIKDRINPLFKEMMNSDAMLITMIAAFALNIVNVSMPTVHMIAALSDSSLIFSPTFKANIAAKQLFNSGNGIVTPKSSVLAEYALKNFPDTTKLINTLVEICRNSRKKADGNVLYFNIYKDMASFRYAQKMLPDQGKRDSLISYYEGLRTIDVERRNPHFWLQYAIARITYPDEKNLEQAKIYLDTGLSLAKARVAYTTTDIETQYARYHLEWANNIITDASEGYNEFLKANALLQSITKKEKYKREAFRPARLYEAFFKKFGHQLDKRQLDHIHSACESIIKNINKLPYRARDNNTIEQCYKSLQAVIAMIKSIRSRPLP